MSSDLPTTATPLWFIDNLVYIHVDGEGSQGAYCLCEIWGARGNMSPLHVHHADEETFYVRDGEVRLFIGDREILLRAGQAALAPRGVPRTYRVESEQAKWIVINSPAGFEHFMRAASEPAAEAELPPPGRPSDAAALAKAAAVQGIEVLGPPGALP